VRSIRSFVLWSVVPVLGLGTAALSSGCSSQSTEGVMVEKAAGQDAGEKASMKHMMENMKNQQAKKK
jgi:hypothetical protein